MIDLQRSQDIN